MAAKNSGKVGRAVGDPGSEPASSRRGNWVTKTALKLTVTGLGEVILVRGCPVRRGTFGEPRRPERRRSDRCFFSVAALTVERARGTMKGGLTLGRPGWIRVVHAKQGLRRQ